MAGPMVAKIIQMIQFTIENRSNHHQDRLLNVIGYHQMNGTKGQRGGIYPDGCSILDLDEHLLITGWWYFFWSVALFMALPYFGYLMRWLNYKSYGTPIPEQYQWQNVSPRLPFGLDSRY